VRLLILLMGGVASTMPPLANVQACVSPPRWRGDRLESPSGLDANKPELTA
jgi:hypothetical protein